MSRELSRSRCPHLRCDGRRSNSPLKMSISSPDLCENKTRRELLRGTITRFFCSCAEAIHIEVCLGLRRLKAWSPRTSWSVREGFFEVTPPGLLSVAPDEFLRRLEQDMETLNQRGRQELASVLRSSRLPSRDKVVGLARILGQPADEYLLLCGYMPDYLMKLLENRDVSEMLKVLSERDLESITKALQVLQVVSAALTSKKGSDPTLYGRTEAGV